MRVPLFVWLVVIMTFDKRDADCKRLAPQNELEIEKVLEDMKRDMRHEFQHENNALKAELADLIALKAELTDLNALKAELAELNSLKAECADLNAVKAELADLNTLKAELAELNALKVELAELNALKAECADLNAVKAELADLNAVKAELTDLKQRAVVFNRQDAPKKRLVLHSDLDINTAFNALRTEVDGLKKGQGSSYVRWGRTTCSGNGTEKVYSGFTGGTYYTVAGGASSNICLPETPTWAHYVDGIQDFGGYVYGTEYETSDSAFGTSAFGKPMQNQDAPCVVCRSPRPVTIMIPGSTGCYAGWKLEYTGYLMTDHHTHRAATDYACVDKDPEAIYHGEANQNGNLFYFSEVRCGSLPCQEYPEGRELACVVCSK